MLSLASPPPAIGGTRRPVIVQFSTDTDIVSGGSAFSVIYDLDAGASVDDTWIFIFNGITVTLTAKASPDASGTQFTSGSTSGSTIASDLAKNYFLDQYFTISSPAADQVQLVAKNTGAQYNIDDGESTWAGFSQFSYNDGIDDTTLANFQAWLDLYIEQVRDAGDYGTAPVAKLTATQSASGFFVFDLSAILDGYVEDDQPPASGTSISATQLPLRRYKFKYCEAYGSPIAPFSITTSSAYFAFFGRRELESAGTSNNSFSDTFLTGRPLTKNLWRAQQDYIYFLVDRRNTVTVTVVAYDSAGGGLASYPITVPSYSGWTVLKIPTSPDQLSLHADTYRYTMQIQYGSPSTSRTYTFYVKHKCPDHSTYLLFRNALGGYDSLPVTGRTTATGAFSSEMGEQILPANYTEQSRETLTYNHMGADEFDMHTGWVFTKLEVEYYARQFMMSENILMPGGEGFRPMVLLTKEVLYTKDRTNLYGFGFKLRRSATHKERHTAYIEQ